MAPEFRTVDDCASRREMCVQARAAREELIFAELRENHANVMRAIGELREQAAFSAGATNERNSHKTAVLPVQSKGGTLKRFSWEKVTAAIVITVSAIFAGFAAARDKGMTKADIVATVKAVLEQERKQP